MIQESIVLFRFRLARKIAGVPLSFHCGALPRGTKVLDGYTCWMVKAGDQDAVPVPNEEIARAWALKNKGRAFRVVEVI
jgi:hypothetical protein